MPDAPQTMPALLERVLDRLPGMRRAVERHGHESLSDYAAGLRRPVPNVPPLADDLLRHAHARAERLLGPARAEALADALAASASALTANHHGLDTHPQSVQGVLAYALGSAGACPVLACGMVPLASFSYPRGLTLARPDPATGAPPRVPLFPASMRYVLVHAAPPLTADMARRALKRVRAMPGAGQATAAEADFMARFIEADCLDPAVLALPRYVDQAVVLQARLLERLLPDGPTVMVLELEDLAVDLLLDDLAGPGGRDALAASLCLDPRIRSMVLEALDGVEGCWSLEKLDRLASRGGDHEARSGAGTALFWGLDAKGRRVPMACSAHGGGAVLRGLSVASGDEPPEALEVPLRADALRQALAQGRLAPGLMLSYAVVGFARGLRCCGGVFQSDYMLAMRRGLAEVLRTRGARAEAEAVAAVPVDNFIAGPEVAFLRAHDGLRPAGLVELAARGGMDAGAMGAAGRLTLRQGLLAGLVDLVEEFVEPELRPDGWRRDVDEWLAKTSGATLL